MCRDAADQSRCVRDLRRYRRRGRAARPMSRPLATAGRTRRVRPVSFTGRGGRAYHVNRPEQRIASRREHQILGTRDVGRGPTRTSRGGLLGGGTGRGQHHARLQRRVRCYELLMESGLAGQWRSASEAQSTQRLVVGNALNAPRESLLHRTCSRRIRPFRCAARRA